MNYLLLIIWPWALAPCCWLFRHAAAWQRLLAIAVVLVEGALLLAVTVDLPARLLGTSVNLSSGARLLFGLTNALVLVALLTHSTNTTPTYVPVLALLMLGCGAAIALFPLPLVGSVFLLLVHMLIALAVADTPATSQHVAAAVGAALKYLVFAVCGTALLFGGVLLYDATGGRGLASALVVVGWALLVGLVPFHLALPSLARHIALIGLSLWAVAQMLGVLLLWTLVDTRLFMEPLTQRLLLGFGVLTVVAALLAWRQPPRTALLLVLRAHLGLAIVALATGGRQGAVGALALLTTHTLATALISMGLSLCTAPSTIRGFRLQPLVLGSIGVGMLTLLGVPPFMGFATLLLLSDALRAAPSILIICIIGISASAWAGACVIRELMQQAPATLEASTAVPPFVPTIIALLIALSLGFGLLPRLLLVPISQAAQALRLVNGQ